MGYGTLGVEVTTHKISTISNTIYPLYTKRCVTHKENGLFPETDVFKAFYIVQYLKHSRVL